MPPRDAPVRLSFFGGAGCVTGSRFLLDDGRLRVLVDCGLFQGYKQLRLRNWEPFPVAPSKIDAVALTHAHIDHSGYLPALVRDGFRGPILATPATRDLCDVLFEDAARLQEEDARRANRQGFSRHHPALPLYRSRDATIAMQQIKTVKPGHDFRIAAWKARFVPNGHIVGSAMLLVTAGATTVLFSGDLGRQKDPIMPPPQPMPACDVLVLESTYGERRHDAADPAEEFVRIANATLRRGGVLLVPAFAVGRAQDVCWLAHRLMQEGRIPRVPIFLDSPMASKAAAILHEHNDLTRLTSREAREVERHVSHVTSPRQSAQLARRKGPFILVSSSGMLTGGRVLNHLKARAADPRNTLLLVGYQAGGTRGARIQAGEPTTKIHGNQVAVRCGVESIRGLSAHADSQEILTWLRTAPRAPNRVYLVHGESDQAEGLKRLIEKELGWRCEVAALGQTVELEVSPPGS